MGQSKKYFMANICGFRIKIPTSAAALKQLEASEQFSNELVSHFHERTGRSRRSPGSSRKPRGMRCLASSAMPISFGAPVLLHVVGPIFEWFRIKNWPEATFF